MIQVGASSGSESRKVGKQAAQRASERLSGEAEWALAFSGGRHTPEEVLQGFRDVLGNIPIVGGSSVGTISNGQLGYSGFEAALAVFSRDLPTPVLLCEADLEKGELELGRRLGERLGAVASPGATILLFYDSIASFPPPVLHVGSRLLDGIYEALGTSELRIIGGGTLGDLGMQSSWVFAMETARRHAVAAVVLPTAFTSETAVLHGCSPAGPFLEVTRSDGAVLHELNGKPALSVIRETLGGTLPEPLSLAITLGEKHGDPYAPYDESLYVNRLVMGADEASGTITLFEADFSEGSRVQLMSRNNQMMIESVQRGASKLVQGADESSNQLMLYIDCAGRTGGFCGAEQEEAQEVRNAVGERVPLLGAYSGVEIAPFLGRSRPLDWTGVLTRISVTEK